jgi:hypothetical protein
MEVDEMKSLLRTKPRLRWNEPHFSDMLHSRDGNREDVIMNLRSPENLVAVKEEQGKYGDTILVLCFGIGDKSMMLPLVVDKEGLYILTYIMRYRPWRQ